MKGNEEEHSLAQWATHAVQGQHSPTPALLTDCGVDQLSDSHLEGLK